MIASINTARASDPAAPVHGFSECHEDILAGLAGLDGLPALAAAAERSRKLAYDTVFLFDQVVLPHHTDEEGDLFPAVISSAAPGAERERAQALAARLTAEHRVIEGFWKALKPVLMQLAAGKSATLQPRHVAGLIKAYSRHAAFEELEFLPLARRVLGRDPNHMAALDLSLHLRHAVQPVGYI
jgi:hypothetical protein